MSSILEALKKAQQEEHEKKEKGVERILWKVPGRQPQWIWRWLGISGVLLALGVCVWVGVSSFQNGWVAPRKPESSSQLLSSPKAKPASPSQTLGTYQLSGILWDEKEPLALINAQLVKNGDEIQGARIVAISKEQVALSRDGKIQILSLGKE